MRGSVAPSFGNRGKHKSGLPNLKVAIGFMVPPFEGNETVRFGGVERKRQQAALLRHGLRKRRRSRRGL
jgi:hypothetical protein